MRILLIYPNCRREIIGYGDEGAIAEPLALEYLASVAIELGHHVQILDLRLHPDRLDLTLLMARPDVVGLTGYSMHVLRMLELCRHVRRVAPQAATVVGGHHATIMPEDFKVPEVDHIVTGEGVGPFRILLERLAADQAVAPLAGVWSRAADETFTFGGKAPEFDIDTIPPPNRAVVAADRHRYFIDWMKPIALMRTTVGCPYRCTFCSLWRIMDGHYHRRDIERVVEEIASIEERNIFLVDDEPFINAKRMMALGHAIQDAGLDHDYFAYCRIDTFMNHLDVMTLWRDIGLKRLFFGVETIFDDELVSYQKRQKRDEIIAGLRTAREMGIAIMSNFIVSPQYGHEQFAQLARFIEDNEVDYPTFTILTPIPGTPACESFDGILDMQPNGRPDWQVFDLQHPVTQTKLPRDEFMREYFGLYRLFGGAYARAGHPFYQPGGLAVANGSAGAPALVTPTAAPTWEPLR
ncbi:radical SAM protein [soil metagenome]